MKTYILVTLGYRTNQYETESYRAQLEGLGYRAAVKGEVADVCVVNTCTVIENADRDSRRQIRRLVREHPGAEVVVTGCAVDAEPGLFAEVDGVTHVVRNREKEELMEKLFPNAESLPEFKIERFEAHTRAFVKVQAGSNVTLKRMNRKYPRQEFYRTVERLKGASPDFTFTTDVIVSFPGERELDFREALAVMDEVQFAKVYMFPDSDRARTKANLFPDKVAPDVIAERKNEVLRRAEAGAHALRESFLGRKMRVLLEREGSGHTDNFLEVAVDGGRPNKMVDVELIENCTTGLVGRCESLSLSA